MRMLWISFLLIGSITCFPEQGGGRQPWWWYVSSTGQNPVKPSDEQPQSSGSVGYPGLYYSATDTAGGDGGSYGVQQQSGPQDSQHGAAGPYQSTEESWTSSSGTGGEDEPVFTPVDDQDQVYAFKSRSRYNRKRLSFNQFRYTPTEPRFSQDPVFPGPRPQDPVKGKF